MAKWQAKQAVGTVTVGASGTAAGTVDLYVVRDNVPIEDPTIIIVPESAGPYTASLYFAEQIAYTQTFTSLTDLPVLNHRFPGLFPANMGNNAIPRYFDPDRNPNYIGESIRVRLVNSTGSTRVFYVYGIWKSHEGAAFYPLTQES